MSTEPERMIGGRPAGQWIGFEYNPGFKKHLNRLSAVSADVGRHELRGDGVYFCAHQQSYEHTLETPIECAYGFVDLSTKWPMIYLRKEYFEPAVWSGMTDQDKAEAHKYAFDKCFAACKLMFPLIDVIAKEDGERKRQEKEIETQQARVEKLSALRAKNDGSFEIALQEEILEEIRKLVK